MTLTIKRRKSWRRLSILKVLCYHLESTNTLDKYWNATFVTMRILRFYTAKKWDFRTLADEYSNWTVALCTPRRCANRFVFPSNTFFKYLQYFLMENGRKRLSYGKTYSLDDPMSEIGKRMRNPTCTCENHIAVKQIHTSIVQQCVCVC